MNIFLDTSCLIAALHKEHINHSECVSLVKHANSKKHKGFIASHTLAELYAVLTRLPGVSRVSPTAAMKLIESSVIENFTLISLSGKEYEGVIKQMAYHQLGGGLVYDALILQCAIKSKVKEFYTLNERHFRILPESKNVNIMQVSSSS